MNNKNLIKTFQGIRLIAFILIFLSHQHIFTLETYDLGTLGVEFFFVLSGFCLFYNYYSQKLDYNINNSFKFAISKIKKLYLLYFLLLIFYFLANTKTFNLYNISIFITKALLLQSFIPNINIYFGIFFQGWFFSSILFLYFSFPYILNFIKTKINNKNIKKYFFITYLIQIIIAVIFYLIKKTDNFEHILDFLYVFPIYRILDFFIGCLLGYNFIINIKTTKNKKKYNFYELFGIVLLIICPILVNYLNNNFNQLFKFIIYPIVTYIIIYVFNSQTGFFSKILSNKIILYLGDLTGYAYLLHIMSIDLIISYNKIYHFIYPDTLINKITIIILYLSLTLVLSIIACNLYNIFNKHKIK